MSATKRYKKMEVGVYDVPEEALRLAEDIQTLEDMLRLKERLEARNFVDTKYPDFPKELSESFKTLRRLGFILSSLQSIAQRKLRDDYMAGMRPRQRPREQTLHDLWMILKDSLDSREGKDI